MSTRLVPSMTPDTQFFWDGLVLPLFRSETSR